MSATAVLTLAVLLWLSGLWLDWSGHGRLSCAPLTLATVAVFFVFERIGTDVPLQVVVMGFLLHPVALSLVGLARPVASFGAWMLPILTALSLMSMVLLVVALESYALEVVSVVVIYMVLLVLFQEKDRARTLNMGLAWCFANALYLSAGIFRTGFETMSGQSDGGIVLRVFLVCVWLAPVMGPALFRSNEVIYPAAVCLVGGALLHHGFGAGLFFVVVSVPVIGLIVGARLILGRAFPERDGLQSG